MIKREEISAPLPTPDQCDPSPPSQSVSLLCGRSEDLGKRHGFRNRKKHQSNPLSYPPTSKSNIDLGSLLAMPPEEPSSPRPLPLQESMDSAELKKASTSFSKATAPGTARTALQLLEEKVYKKSSARQQDILAVSTQQAYRPYVNRYRQWWIMDQAREAAEATALGNDYEIIPEFPITAVKVAHFLEHECQRGKVSSCGLLSKCEILILITAPAIRLGRMDKSFREKQSGGAQYSRPLTLLNSIAFQLSMTMQTTLMRSGSFGKVK